MKSNRIFSCLDLLCCNSSLNIPFPICAVRSSGQGLDDVNYAYIFLSPLPDYCTSGISIDTTLHES